MFENRNLIKPLSPLKKIFLPTKIVMIRKIGSSIQIYAWISKKERIRKGIVRANEMISHLNCLFFNNSLMHSSKIIFYQILNDSIITTMILKIFLLILLIPVIIISIVLIINVLPLPDTIEGSRGQIGAVAAGFFSFLYLVWIFFYTVNSFRRAGRVFNELCLGLGLKGESLGIFGRKYSGTMSERQITIDYFPPKTIQRALLNIYIEASLVQEFTVSRQRPLLGSGKNRILCQEIVSLAGDFKIYSGDCNKTFTIISRYEFKKALGSILSVGHGNSFKQIYFESDRIWLRQRFTRLSAEVLEDYIKNLLALASEAENQ